MVANNVSYAVAVNCMTLIKNGAVNDAFDALGIRAEDFEMVCNHTPWIGADRYKITQCLQSMIWGTLDVVGLPRIEVPTEFIASCISCFVSAGNIAVACRWMETGHTAEDVAAGGHLEEVTANQLFALCCKLVTDAPTARARWEQRTGRAVSEVMDLNTGG